VLKTAICDLFGIKHPIIQGGMAHLGTAELVSAVSNAGGLGIIGAGQMGHGIALIVAQAGFDVIIRDTTDDFVNKGIGKIEIW
jgi:NAD(P)H-dependent flavin oxidoreductase YrpB (nitropropane dioxygenase family)